MTLQQTRPNERTFERTHFFTQILMITFTIITDITRTNIDNTQQHVRTHTHHALTSHASHSPQLYTPHITIRKSLGKGPLFFLGAWQLLSEYTTNPWGEETKWGQGAGRKEWRAGGGGRRKLLMITFSKKSIWIEVGSIFEIIFTYREVEKIAQNYTISECRKRKKNAIWVRPLLPVLMVNHIAPPSVYRHLNSLYPRPSLLLSSPPHPSSPGPFPSFLCSYPPLLSPLPVPFPSRRVRHVRGDHFSPSCWSLPHY